MSTLTNDLARLANNANVLVGAITTNTTAITAVNSATYYVGSTLIANSTGPYGKTEGNLNVNNATTAYGKTESNLNVNNSVTSNTANTATYLGAANNTGNSSGIFTNGTVNALSLSVSTNFIANSTGVYTGVVNGSTISVGTSVIANSVGVTTTGFVNAATVVNSASHTIGSTLIANTLGVYHTGTMNAASHTVGTAFTANATVVNAVSYYAGTTLIGNTTGPYGKTEGNLNVNNATTAYGKTEGNLNVNNATTAYGKTEGNLNVNNATTAYSKTEGNLNVNNATYLGSTVNLGNSSGIFSTGGVVSGSATDGQILLTDTVNGGIEIGKTGRTNAGTPYIDFHSSASSPDYDIRVLASSGNSTAGSGALTVYHGGNNTFFAANGNFGIGNSAPAHKFSVNGTGYFGGQFGINISPQNNVQLQMGGTLVSGTATSYSIYSSGTIPSTSTTGGYNYISALNTQAAAFTCGTLMHFGAYQGTIGAASVVTNQYGFYAGPMTAAGSNYGFYGDIAAGTGRYNFYAAGTADNYFAGNTGIGNTAPVHKLSVNGISYFGNTLVLGPAGGGNEGGQIDWSAGNSSFNGWSTDIYTSTFRFFTPGAGSLGNGQVQMFSSNASHNVGLYVQGNTGIGTSAPAYKLDVSGTAHITGAVTLDTALTVGSGGTGATTITGLVKGNGTSAFTAAARGTDYSLLNSGTSTASTSGTTIDFTGIPSGVKRINVIFNGVSISAIGSVAVVIGISSGFEATGYTSMSGYLSNAAASGATNLTTGFLSIYNVGASVVCNGMMTLVNTTGNTWVASGTIGAVTYGWLFGGTKTLGGTLDRVRFSATAGAFNAGSVNIFYEY